MKTGSNLRFVMTSTVVCFFFVELLTVIMAQAHTMDENSTLTSTTDNRSSVFDEDVTAEIEDVITTFFVDRKPHITSLSANDLPTGAPIIKLVDELDEEIKIDPATKKERCIMIVGDSGHGKSTIINWLVGKDVSYVSHNMERGTAIPHEVKIDSKAGGTISLFDTIGFEKTNLEGIRLLNRMILNEFCCNMILFVRNITDIRTERVELEEFKVYRYDFDVPIILVLNQACEKTKGKYQRQWKDSIAAIEYENILNDVILLDSVSTDENEVPYGINDLVEKAKRFLKRQPKPKTELFSRVDQLQDSIRRTDALQFSKRALIPVGIAAAAALTIGLSPIPFADWPLLITTQLSMFIGICAAFRLQIRRGILIWLVSVGVGAFGLGFATKAIVGVLKAIPGANVLAMVIDGSVSFSMTLALGLALIAILRGLHIKGIDLSIMNEEEQKKLLKDMMISEVKDKWKQLKSKTPKDVLNEEKTKTDGIETSMKLTLDVDKLIQTHDDMLRKEKLQKSVRQTKLEELEKKGIPANTVCQICLRSQANIIVLPCRHSCICETDYIDHISHKLFKRCPECGNEIESYEKVQQK